MNRKYIWLIVILLLVGGIVFYNKLYKETAQKINNSNQPEDTASINTTGLPLVLPPGFSISVFAKDLPGARVMALGAGGMWVSQTSEGKVSFLEIKDGKVTEQHVVLSSLRKPHGLAIWCLLQRETNPDACQLYIAEEDKISRAQISYLTPTLSDIGEGERVRLGALQKIANLPYGGGHFTRTIKFGPDDRLYVSIGSSCNVCNEKDARRAAIYSMSKDGSDFRQVASGLRNSVFFSWSYIDGQMWVTEMGRDYLGDDTPPDEINIIKQGQNYGWPICYGQNIHDANYDKNTYIQNPCNGKESSFIDIPAHSAPLGLAFVPQNTNWPADFKGDLLVALHGSWNRSVPTGYKIVRISAYDQGDKKAMEDFISGWLAADGKIALGRPVDLLFGPDGGLYISDDKAGVIYKVSYHGLELTDQIQVEKPQSGSAVKSPLVVEGKARGSWFFEASFPVNLLDGNGQQISIGVAEAQEDWMTDDFVPFRVELGFAVPETDTGTLVLEKDNPSGLPENAAELRIPVKFR